MNYTELLQNPRWQKRRLEIFQRFDFRCQGCKSTCKTLHAHHRYYISNRMPWDYPDCAFVCLCVDCHAIPSVTDWFRFWEMAMTDAEALGLDGISITFLMDSVKVAAETQRVTPIRILQMLHTQLNPSHLKPKAETKI